MTPNGVTSNYVSKGDPFEEVFQYVYIIEQFHFARTHSLITVIITVQKFQ